MPLLLKKNNAKSLITNNPLAQSATTVNINTGDGTLFPATGNFLLTIWDAVSYPDPTDDPGMEIVLATARTDDAITITRAQEETLDIDHVVGSTIAMLITAGLLDEYETEIETKQATLVSGTNIKTVNSTSLLGSGDIITGDMLASVYDPTNQAAAVAFESSVATRLAGKKPFHGVFERGIGASNPLPTHLTTTTFTLGATANPIIYYYQGTEVVVNTNKTTTLDDGLLGSTAGLYYVYFNAATGNILATKTFPGISIDDNVIIATVAWNGSDYGLVSDERHSYNRNTEFHGWAHNTIGTRYRSGITLTVNTTAETFATTAGEIWDEDIRFTVNASSAFPTPNAGRIIYQTSATTIGFLNSPSVTPGYLGVNSRPYYVNHLYALVEMSTANNRYINVFVYATTDLHTPIYFVTEKVTEAIATANGYATLADARAVGFPDISGTGLSPEMRPIYRLIWRADGTLQAIDLTQDDYRTVSSLPMAAGTTSTTASAVTFNPYGSISATNVQSALQELDDEKAVVGGSDTYVQFNDGSILGGDADFTFDKTNNILKVESATNGTINTRTLQPSTIDADIYLKGNGVGSALLISSDVEYYVSVNSSQIFLRANNYEYDFYGNSVSNIRGILNFASLATTNKTFTFPNTTGNIVVDAATQTLTNKRVTPRITTQTSSATPTINSDNADIHTITALAVDITSMTTNLSGTPTEGQKLIIKITGTATRLITWGTGFESSTITLPTTTSGTTTLTVGFIFNGVDKWTCVAVA